MVGTLRSTDAAFTSTDGREASTTFGVGYGCGRAGHPTTAHVQQYVRLSDHPGQRQLGPLGRLGRPLPNALLNSRTVSIEHHDNGGRTAGSGKGVVPEAVIVASIALDALLLRGDLAELKAAGSGSAPAPRPRSPASSGRSRSTATSSTTTPRQRRNSASLRHEAIHAMAVLMLASQGC